VGDGILRTPRIAGVVSGVPDATKAVEKGRIVSQSTCDRVRELLYGVVGKGSGKHAAVEGFAVGGKTGTAQKYKNGIIDSGKYISSFVGFLSVGGKAKYSAYIMVDEPAGASYYGSIVAAPYVGKIFKEIVNIMKLPADPNIPAPFVPEWLRPANAPRPLVEMPNVAGMQLFEAEAKLQSLGFFVDIDDETNPAATVARGSFPAAGSKLKYGEPVVILC